MRPRSGRAKPAISWISEVLPEQGYDGRTYFVQYFERHRLEYHPENVAPYTIQLGQLGRQIYETRYGTK